MDPWKDPPGWRAELGWGVAALAAAVLCIGLVPLLPAIWMGGRWTRAADE